jgi:hypothetical protein
MTRFFAGGLDARNAFLAFFPCPLVMASKKSFLINVLCLFIPFGNQYLIKNYFVG